ncbi:MAG: serine/threonine protein kinase [Myxococcaceae bacterium]|nr:serine/threonine protein kinase [Myxococcaceae bacterium]
MTSSRVEWVEGAPIGRYSLVRLLARGGMAQVWLARQHGPAGFVREVCIKGVLSEHGAVTGETGRLFLAEAQLAAQLKHPNVVQVLDFDEANGTPYLVMEYLEGETLAALFARCVVANTPLSPRLAAGVMERCARGLGYAHQKAKRATGEPLCVVHRDFAPHNVFLTSDGHVKVLDFGIARAVGAPMRTGTGLVRGRAAYMAPEQAAGEAVPGSDVFSMGIVFFELLTGRRFWPDQDALGIFQRLLGDAPLPSPREHNPFVPPALDALVRRMLARTVAERFADGVACAEALSGWARDARQELSEEELAGELRLRAPSGPFARPSAPHAVTLVKGAAAPVPPSAAPPHDPPAGPTVLLFPPKPAADPADDPFAEPPPSSPQAGASAPTELVPRVSLTPHAPVLPSAPPVPRPSRPPAPRPSARPPPSATVVDRPAVVPPSPASASPAAESPGPASPAPAPSAPRRRRAPEPPIGVSRSRAPLFVLVGVATVIVVGAGLLLTSGGSPPPVSPASASPPVPSLVAALPASPTPPSPTPPAPAEPGAPRVSLRISSAAPAAVVLRDDVIIGQVPLVIEGLEGEIVELAIEAPGFTRRSQKVRLSKGFDRLELSPERAPRPTKQAKPKSPPALDLLNPYD